MIKTKLKFPKWREVRYYSYTNERKQHYESVLWMGDGLWVRLETWRKEPTVSFYSFPFDGNGRVMWYIANLLYDGDREDLLLMTEDELRAIIQHSIVVFRLTGKEYRE